MQKQSTYTFLLAISLVVAACSPATRIEKSWRDPSVTVDTSTIHKFLVAALLRDESTRHIAEDKMAALYPGKAVPSYNVLGTGELKQGEEFYKAKLKDEGYDGVVVIRLVNVEKDQWYVPGNYPTYYRGWYGYYRYASPYFYDPGYYTTDKTFYAETNVYSLRRDKLIWTGITSTINPANSNSLVDEIIKVVNKKMQDEKFIE